MNIMIFVAIAIATKVFTYRKVHRLIEGWTGLQIDFELEPWFPPKSKLYCPGSLPAGHTRTY